MGLFLYHSFWITLYIQCDDAALRQVLRTITKDGRNCGFDNSGHGGLDSRCRTVTDGSHFPALIAPLPTAHSWHSSSHSTMGPQPELARHGGSRRLVVNGVKCMLNYSELSIFHEYGNIFPISCTFFALQMPKIRALTQSLETSSRLAKSVG